MLREELLSKVMHSKERGESIDGLADEIIKFLQSPTHPDVLFRRRIQNLKSDPASVPRELEKLALEGGDFATIAKAAGN